MQKDTQTEAGVLSLLSVELGICGDEFGGS